MTKTIQFTSLLGYICTGFFFVLSSHFGQTKEKLGLQDLFFVQTLSTIISMDVSGCNLVVFVTSGMNIDDCMADVNTSQAE